MARGALAIALATGVAALTPGNVLLYRVGPIDGTVPLTSSSEFFGFDEYNPVTRTRVSSIEANCTVSGTSLESYPTLSLNKLSVVFPCWAAPSGVALSTTYRQAIGRFFLDGTLDWPKGAAFPATSSGLRSASWTGVASDGYWVGTSSGMKYAPAGPSTSFANVISSSSSSVRGVSWDTRGGMWVSHYQSPTPGIAFLGNPAFNTTATNSLNLLTTNIVGSTGLGLTGMNALTFSADAVTGDQTLWACDSGLGLAKFAVGGTLAAPTLTMATGYPKRPYRADGVLAGCRGVAVVPNATSGGLSVFVTGASAGSTGFLSSFDSVAETFTLVAASSAGVDFRFLVAVPEAPPASATPTRTPSVTGSPSNTRSNTGTGTQTPSPTGSVSNTPTPTLSAGAVPSPSSTPTPSRTPSVQRFAAENLLLLRGGTPGGTLSSVAQPLALVEMTPSGDVVGTIPLPTVTDAAAGTFRCTLGYSSNYQSEGFLQRSFDGKSVVIGCNDAVAGTANPNNISTRVITVVRADGTMSQFPVRSAFRDSTSGTIFRTVTSADASGVWMTGSTSSTASNGLHYVPFGSAQSERVAFINAGNQRYVHVGPSWPGSGRPASEPQLYVSLRDPIGQRGVHSVGTGLPTANVTDGTVLLPGFADVNAVATSINLPLINSFCFEPDGRTLWTSDTTGWGTVTPAVTGFERLNVVQYVWSDATQGYARGVALPVDSSNVLNFTGQQVQLVHGRYEGAGNAWTLYTVNNGKAFRIVPSTGTVTTIATPPAGTFWYGSAFVPFDASLQQPSASASRAPTTSNSATGSSTASVSSSATPTNTPTGSISVGVAPSTSSSTSATATGSVSATASLTASRTPSASPSAQFQAFASDSLAVLRVGEPGGSLTAGSARAVFVDEFSPLGALLGSYPLPRSYSSARGAARGACTLAAGSTQSGAWRHDRDGLPTLSTDGKKLVVLCANVTNGTALAVGVQRTIATIDAAGVIDTVTGSTGWSNMNGTNEYSGRSCALKSDVNTFYCVGQSRSFNGFRSFIPGAVGNGAAIQNAWGGPGALDGRFVTISPSGGVLGVNGPADEGWSGVFRLPVGGASLSLLSAFGPSPISPWGVTWESETAFWVAVDHDLGVGNVHRYTSSFSAEANATVWALDGSPVSLAPNVPILSVTGRVEGTDGFVLYASSATSVYRFVPSSGVSAVVIATAVAGTAFRGVTLAPFDGSLSPRSATPTASPTRSATASVTATTSPTSSPTTSVSATPSATASITEGASITATASASLSGTPASTSTSSVSGTRTPTPSPSGVFAAFNPASLVVLRVGDGSAALTAGTSRPVFVDEFLQTGGSLGTILVNTVAAPRSFSSARGNARGACTLSTGTTTSGSWRHDRDGLPTLSTDGKKLVVLCANVTNGTALAVGVQRTIATLDASGAWDTVTGVNAYNNQNTTQTTNEHGGRMCALKSDVNVFYCVGLSRSFNGFRSFLPNTVGTGSALLNAWGGAGCLDGRGVSISPSGAVLGVNGPVDAGWAGLLTLPTPNQTTALLPGFAGSSISPWGVTWESETAFWVADDSAVATRNAVRFVLSGGLWAAESSHSLAPGVAVASITGRWEAGVFVIYATTNTALIRYTAAEGATVLATAPANTVFRGVALPPADASLPRPTASASPTSGLSPTGTRSSAPSVTATPSGTPSNSGAPTTSATGTAPPTTTSSGTGSASLTRTPTPSQTGTGSASGTGTSTRTGTSSASRTRSQTGTPSASGTGSMSATASETASVSATASPTASVSASGTGTPSSSQTETGTPSASGTQTGTPSASSSGTAASTGTGTPSASSTGTPASTGTGTPAASGTATKTRVSLPSATPSRTKTRTRTASRTKTKTKTRTPSKKKKLMA